MPDFLNAYERQQLSIGQTVSDQFKMKSMIGQTVSAQFKKQAPSKSQTASDQFDETQLAKKIISNLSFSHISLLLTVEDKLQRAIYAIEAIKGTWSVKELRRQINSLLFERCGLSKKPKLLLSRNKNISKQAQATFIKDIYTFEFLGLAHKDAVEESDLETALLDHLQEFFLEMGHGFCLEARQKRILIGNEYNSIDLVFYPQP